MKKNFILFAAALSTLLYGCSQDNATSDEPIPATQTVQIDEVPAPLNFEQMRQIVGEVLGGDVAATIEPTSRHLRLTFEDQTSMLLATAKGDMDFSPSPIVDVESVNNEQRPNTMYSLMSSDMPLPDIENCKVEVLEQYCNPLSSLSGLTEQQAALVVERIRKERSMPETRFNDLLWKPAGKIRYYDPVLMEYVPVANAVIKLVGHRQMSLEPLYATCFTDSEGNYRSDETFYGSVISRILWSSQAWVVFDDDDYSAETVDTLQTYHRWNLDINATTPNRAYDFATVHLALQYMHNTFGYKVVPSSNICIAIKCLNQVAPEGQDDKFYENFIVPTIMLYCGNKNAFQIYCATNREAGKVAQYLRIIHKTSMAYSNYSGIITNSWGEFTKFIFPETYYQSKGALLRLHQYTTEYGDRTPRPDNLNQQWWHYATFIPANDIRNLRTSLFIDIWDDFNQIKWPEFRFTGDMKYPTDRVCYKNVQDIIDWSILCTSVKELKEKVAELPYTATSATMAPADVDDLFRVFLELENAQPQ